MNARARIVVGVEAVIRESDETFLAEFLEGLMLILAERPSGVTDIAVTTHQRRFVAADRKLTVMRARIASRCGKGPKCPRRKKG